MVENLTTATAVAIIISLILDWFPGVNIWWETTFTTAQKRGINAALVFFASAGVMWFNCQYYTQCPADWAEAIMNLFVVFLTSATTQQVVREFTTKNHALNDN